MQNYVQTGNVIALTAPYTRLDGEGALVGSIFGVACSDVTSGDVGQFQTEGVFTLAKTSAQAWTVGQKIYWDNSNKRCDSDSTVGQLIGVATAVAANPTSTGNVRLNGNAPATAEGAQAAIVALTDSSGYSGTHDDTIAAMSAITTITDSSGYDSTHNDTIAAMTAIVTLTDNTGGSGSHDDTLAAITVPTLTDWNGSSVYPSAAQGTAISDAVTALKQNQSDIGQKVIELVAREAVIAQNISDLAQKEIELVARDVVAAQNISDLTQKILEIRTALINAGILASS